MPGNEADTSNQTDPVKRLLSDIIPRILEDLSDQISTGVRRSQKVDQPNLTDASSKNVFANEVAASPDDSDLTKSHAIGTVSGNDTTGGRSNDYFQSTDISALNDMLLSGNTTQAEQLVKNIHAKGIETDALMCDFLGGSARELGERWVEDRCSFTDVTIATAHLIDFVRQFGLDHNNRQIVDRAKSELKEKQINYPSLGGKVLLATVPGEQHVFGLQIINFMLRAKGLISDMILNGSAEELALAVSTNEYKFIVLSVGCERNNVAVKDLIRRLRKNSSSPCQIYIGGYAVDQNMISTSYCGADGSCSDARDLVSIVESVIAGKELVH